MQERDQLQTRSHFNVLDSFELKFQQINDILKKEG